jgi:hypothetical protein
MSQLKLPFQVVEVRHVSGRQDASKKYTVVGGLITLPDGKQGYAELMMSDTHHLTPGQYQCGLDVQIDRDRRLTLRCTGFTAVPAKAA